MNALATMSAVQTMSSREIADLCEKRHDNVMRDIRDMLAQLHGEGDALKFEGVYRGANGEDRLCFHLPKRETLILVSGYKLDLRAKIIDRWQELEAQQTVHLLPRDYATALRALADETEKAQELEAQARALTAQIEHDAPKVAFAEQVEMAPDAITIAQAAKLLGTGRNRLSAKLREIGWLTRLGEPYQHRIEAGMLDVRIGSWDHPDKGLQRSVTALITGKGIARLDVILADWLARQRK